MVFGTFITVFGMFALLFIDESLSQLSSNVSLTDITDITTVSRNITKGYDPSAAVDEEDDDDEMRLVKDLFNENDNRNVKTVRPTKEKDLPVEVKFGIAYTQVVDLIEKDQVLVSNIWVRMKWHNHLLRWNESEYGGIKTININPGKVWLPDIVLHNNAEETLPSGTLYNFKNRVILTSDGGCTWYAPTILRSGCEIDITYFPFDDQKCELKFGSWTYNGLEVNVVQMSDKADLKFYMESSEFELISAKAERNVVTYSCCPEPYPDITFYIHIRRIPFFFLFNIIIPCMVVTSFSVFTFAFPPEFGERITLVIESFLAMSVVILTVADSIPVTSDATPLIVKILLAAMFQIGLALIANCVSLNLYKKTEMPQWVRVFFLHYLARMLCINTGHPKANVRSTRRVDVTVDEIELNYLKLAGANPFQPGNLIASVVPGMVTKPTSTLATITDGIDEVAKSSQRQEDNEQDREFWIFTSQIADRIFLIIFSIVLVCSVSAILSQVPDHYSFPW
ncbi:neuronal acetylcholine receptor subunit alpha-10-like isoform X2 [Montipora capricornis]|uniref:neuronal acetylcholine receptor subunit alpha-10-like isoform X2 n=1 Tax=Montipora capricornis TaxID=246305 RepID=UPI0035F12A46